LAVVCKTKQWNFCYYIKQVRDRDIITHPAGNLKVALEYDAKIVEVDGKENWENTLNMFKHLDPQQNKPNIYIAQGAHQQEAEEGLKELATEILHFYWKRDNGGKEMNVFLPSGTGTTAVFLSKHLHPHNVKVTTCPVVESKNYLISQMKDLVGDTFPLPTIIDTPKKYTFGQLYQDFINVHQELQRDTNVIFDLMYDPKGWMALDQHRRNIKMDNVMYIHCGGLLGNITMQTRYKINQCLQPSI